MSFVKKSRPEQNKDQIKTTHKTSANFCMTGRNQKYILCVSVFFITAITKSLCWKKKLSIDFKKSSQSCRPHMTQIVSALYIRKYKKISVKSRTSPSVTKCYNCSTNLSSVSPVVSPTILVSLLRPPRLGVLSCGSMALCSGVPMCPCSMEPDMGPPRLGWGEPE